VDFKLRDRGLALFATKNVREAALDDAQCTGIRKDWDLGALMEIERPHVVEAHQMVGMRMRV
jgi:hypothetical protein